MMRVGANPTDMMILSSGDDYIVLMLKRYWSREPVISAVGPFGISSVEESD